MPTTILPPGARETDVLEIVAAGPLMDKVLSPMMRTLAPGAAGESVCPAITMLVG